MSLTKKSDVKNHLSARYRRGIHLAEPASLADATGFSEEQSSHPDSGSQHLPEKFFPQPVVVAPEGNRQESQPGLNPVAVPAVLKVPQA